MRELYSLCVSVAEIAPTPMSAPPPSPQNAMTLIGSAFILPLRMSALRPAPVPRAAEPDEPSCVRIHGTTQGVVEYVVVATYMPPVEPSTSVRASAATHTSVMNTAARQPGHV